MFEQFATTTSVVSMSSLILYHRSYIKPIKNTNFAKNKRFDIVLIREPHCNDTETENSWIKDWFGDSFWNHGTNLSKGMSVLFNRSHNLIVSSVTDFVYGRASSIKLLCNDKNFQIINVLMLLIIQQTHHANMSV